jgi:hypothetical protein
MCRKELAYLKAEQARLGAHHEALAASECRVKAEVVKLQAELNQAGDAALEAQGEASRRFQQSIEAHALTRDELVLAQERCAGLLISESTLN